jgi:hypothetical protein
LFRPSSFEVTPQVASAARVAALVPRSPRLVVLLVMTAV